MKEFIVRFMSQSKHEKNVPHRMNRLHLKPSPGDLMSNITSAKSSLRAELAHVQSGLAYYKARVEALNAAIDQLDSIGDEGQVDVEQGEGTHMQKMRRARKSRQGGPAAVAAATKSPKATKVPKAGRQGRAGTRLPSTGGDFFPDLINEQRQSMSDLLHAAATQLPFKATAEELTQLRSRLVAAVNHMLQAGKIRDEGKGRARVYFKA
jgi:hypothetical protein